jgi:hypothetical protein
MDPSLIAGLVHEYWTGGDAPLRGWFAGARRTKDDGDDWFLCFRTKFMSAGWTSQPSDRFKGRFAGLVSYSPVRRSQFDEMLLDKLSKHAGRACVINLSALLRELHGATAHLGRR